jgi:cytochrome c oxidase subunit IV
MSEHASSSEHGAHTEHIVPVSTYIIVFICLLLLTGLTTGAAYIDMGAFNTVVALAIAVCKMLLVVLFFMHVKYATGLTKLVVIAGIFWLAILVTLTLADELTRGWSPVPQPWTSNPGLLLPFLFHWFL